MRKHFWPTVIKIVLFILIIIVAYLVYMSIQEKGDEHEQSVIGRFHNIGDAMGGMTAPLIGLISALLVYLSFKAQVDANRLTSEIRNDQSLNDNLKNSLDRIETKFKRITDLIGGEKRFSELFMSLAGHYRFLTTVGYDRLSRIPPFDLEKDAIPIIRDIKGLQENCFFFCQYISIVSRSKNLTIENRHLLSLYIAEYLYFFNNRLDVISPLTPLMFKENEENFLNRSIDEIIRNHRFLQEREGDLHEVNILFVQSDRGRESKWKHIWEILTKEKDYSLKQKWDSIKHIIRRK